MIVTVKMISEALAGSPMTYLPLRTVRSLNHQSRWLLIDFILLVYPTSAYTLVFGVEFVDNFAVQDFFNDIFDGDHADNGIVGVRDAVVVFVVAHQK